MPLGYGLLIFAMVATVAANVLLALSVREGREKLLLWGRRAALASTGGIVGAAGYLGYLIATHQFQVSYVAEYSARRSNSWYLMAAFWGGQEGSILLWALLSAVLSAVLIVRGGRHGARVWPLYGLVQIYLLALLLLKCPFKLGTGPVPLDGKGLNPLLENYWMVIHPPMLFLGWSSTVFPAVFAIDGLLRKDWDGWAKAAFSWSLFSFAALGLGLSLGGYWAYETLGWGGFWAWDPVENSSLVPWLLLTALLHAIPVQLKNGGMRPATFLLAFLPFASMNYGTFLTRTGLLSDFSVHSFSSLGNDGYKLMLGALLVITFVPLGLLLWRWKSMPKGEAYDKLLTREFGYSLGTILLGLIGLLVLVGMSAPLLTKLGPVQQLLKPILAIDPKKGAAAPAAFYDQMGYPIALMMTVLMAATPYMAWKNNQFEALGKKLFPSYIVAIVLTMAVAGAAWYLGAAHPKKPLLVLLFATSTFTAIANLMLVLPRLKHPKPRLTVGGMVAHAGAGMTLAGVACLVIFSQNKENIELRAGVPVNVLGYKLTYVGNLTQPFDREGNRIRIRVEKDGKAWESRPRYYFAPWDGKDTLFGNPPAIHRRFWGDLYISHAGDMSEILDDPEAQSFNSQFTLEEQKPKSLGGYTLTLVGAELDEKSKAAIAAHSEAALNALPQTRISAIISVKYNDGSETFVKPAIRQERNQGMFSEPVEIPGPAGKKVILRFVPPPSEREVAEANVGRKQAVDEATKAGAPGSPAFREALMRQPGYFQAQQMEDLANFKSLRFETFNAPDATDTVYVSLGTKPMVWLVWLGTLLFSGGGYVAYRRRAMESAQPSVNDEDK